MSVKRYYWDSKSDCDCEIVEQPDGAMVDYDEHASVIAALEARCAALAAENEKRNTHSEALAVDNAALREVVERMVNQFAMSGISPEEKSINPAKSLMFDAKSALFMPATDAYLAEVRASGVEMFGQYHNFSEKLFIQKESKKFAAQLRKGVQS